MTGRWFVLNINPEPWAIGSLGVHRRGGKLGAHVDRNAQLATYQAAVKEEVGPQPMITGKVKLRLYFWRQQALYTSTQAKSVRKHEADVTNLQKATEDALQGILFPNDKDVNDIHSVMVEQGPLTIGRVVIYIEESGEMPDVMAELPTEVCELLDAMDNPPEPSDQKWGDGNAIF